MSDLLTKMADQGLLDSTSIDAVRASVAQGQSLDEAVLGTKAIDEAQLLQFLSRQIEIPLIDLDKKQPEAKFLAQFPANLLIDHQLIPLREQDGIVQLATSRLFNAVGVDELRLATGREYQLVLAPSNQIARCLKSRLGIGADTVQMIVSGAGADGIELLEDDEEELDLASAAEDTSVIRFVNQVLTEAIELRSTDVHFEPFENQLQVRYRIDGILMEANVPAEARKFHAAIVSRIKIMAHLDIAEKRLPQDGRIKLKVSGREIDMRISVIPMLHGEAVVLRILDRSTPLIGLQALGMAEQDMQTFEKVLHMPHGIVLVTGPTGSGKTTTLYSGLSSINDIERKIVTIEDPVEYQLPGINQIQVSAKAGLTFARGLRSILRHDPDVILIGEIRDQETAEIAVQASLTGHLVFSTLHTNDAPSAPTRLVDMGIEPYLVASSLEMVVAQRLVRLICPECKQPDTRDEIRLAAKNMHLPLPETYFFGAGCRACRGTGYRGRAGIFELMPVNEPLRALILKNRSASEIRQLTLQHDMSTLHGDGWRLVLHGQTTLEEVLRVCKDEQVNGNRNGAV